MAEKNFRKPTEIQLLTLPAAIMGKKDILGAAQTGSGKTLAFGIPILNGIMELKMNGTSVPARKIPVIKKISPPEESEKSAKKGKQKKRNDRDNLTPPPEEVNNFVPFDDVKIAAASEKPLYALVLTPTRELCVQVKDHLVAAAKYTDINIAAVFGGLAQVKQERLLKKCPEIVVATPGRLWELIKEGNEHLNKLRNIKYV